MQESHLQTNNNKELILGKESLQLRESRTKFKINKIF